jgi:hypothetical protein
MRVLVMPRGIRHVLFFTIGLMPFLPPIAMAEKLAVDAQMATHVYTGECNGEVRPDRAVIVGGISAQGLKPAVTKAQLDKQIDAVRQYVAGKQGRLVLFEVLRAAQSATRASSSENTATQPFILVQSLEAEFPLTQDIDAILERLLQLGFDRYGKQVRVESSSGGPSVMVYYRFSDLRSQLDRAHTACKQRLVMEWCSSVRGHQDGAACKTTEQLDQRFPTISASFQSLPVLREHGGRAPYYLQYPWQSAQLGQVELLGNMPLSLSGPLMIRTSDNQP